MRRLISLTYQSARRIVIGLIGGTVVLLGLIMIVTPGPAFVVIPVGLAILSIEFAFARRWLKALRERISRNGFERRNRSAENWRKSSSG
ncbi:MAG: PGPGW domain-containing protein [Pseudomonadota bacterium]